MSSEILLHFKFIIVELLKHVKDSTEPELATEDRIPGAIFSIYLTYIIVVPPQDTGRCCDVESTSMTLIQCRNNAVCPLSCDRWITISRCRLARNRTYFKMNTCRFELLLSTIIVHGSMGSRVDPIPWERDCRPSTFYVPLSIGHRLYNITTWPNIGQIQLVQVDRIYFAHRRNIRSIHYIIYILYIGQ